MMEVKKTIKYDGKIKSIRVVDKAIVDAEGEVVDLIAILAKVYGENSFDLSTTCKEEEIIDAEPDEEYDINDDGTLGYE